MPAEGVAGPPESWAALHEEIGRLPEGYREPVVLCYLEGLSTEEAALRLGCPRGTILSRLSRARERLRDRLIRRGLAPGLVPLAAGSRPIVPAAMPLSLQLATVGDALAFAGRRAAEAALPSVTATAMARGLIQAMTLSRWTTLGGTALSCALLAGVVPALGILGAAHPGPQPPARVTPDDDFRAGLTRSVNEIQAEIDRTTRQTDELRKELEKIRARVDALRRIEWPAVAKKSVVRIGELLDPNPSHAVAELTGVLKQHPPRPGARKDDAAQLYMMDLVAGGTTLFADEVFAGKTFNGSAKWSHDGKRIIFDATPGNDWSESRIVVLDARDGQPSFTDLGPGNCPNFSRDDRRIAFLINPGAPSGEASGIWVMHADGSERKQASGMFGAPFWSQNGRELLIYSFTVPTSVTAINLAADRVGTIDVPGYHLFSWPRWAGPGQVVASLGTGGAVGDLIALLDVREPAQAKIIEVLWKRSPDLDVEPKWPLYSPETQRCYFTGVEDGKGQLLLSVKRGENGRATRLEPQVRQKRILPLDFSPDGHYLVFGANRPEDR
jgi:Tol biopolymer transport system component